MLFISLSSFPSLSTLSCDTHTPCYTPVNDFHSLFSLCGPSLPPYLLLLLSLPALSVPLFVLLTLQTPQQLLQVVVLLLRQSQCRLCHLQPAEAGVVGEGGGYGGGEGGGVRGWVKVGVKGVGGGGEA